MAFAESPALSFVHTWDAVVASLRAGSAQTEVPAANVVHGELGRAIPKQAPALFVYLIPAGPSGPSTRAPNGLGYLPEAELHVFALVEPAPTSRDAIARAMAVAERALAVLAVALPLAGVRVHWDAQPVRLDGHTTKGAVATLTGRVHYAPAEGGTVPEDWPPVFGSPSVLTEAVVRAIALDVLATAVTPASWQSVDW